MNVLDPIHLSALRLKLHVLPPPSVFNVIPPCTVCGRKVESGVQVLAMYFAKECLAIACRCCTERYVVESRE